MSTFINYFMKEEYSKFKALGDPLDTLDTIIDWEGFRPLLRDMYSNDEGKGGRPNIDEIIMFKMLVLQEYYGLSDPELERQANDRISFRHFLGYPPKIPDKATIWLFRERIKESGLETLLWEELQRQIDAKGLEIKRGVIQDAAFVTSDPGHAKEDTPRGDKAKTRRSRDGTWAKKGNKSFFGYKNHILIDKDYQLIRKFETTTASVHDSQVDLSEPGQTVYRDKGYFGTKPKASMNKTMDRRVRGKSLTPRQKRRNKAISRVRGLVERPFAVINRVFHAATVMVTTVTRTNVKNMFRCLNYNLFQLRTLKKQMG